MFEPKFKYTDNIVTDLGKIEKHKTVLDMSSIPISMELQLREEAKLKMTHFSTRIEGNPLDLKQVEEIVKKDSGIIKHRTELEVRNYWDALSFLETQKRLNSPISEKFIKKLNAIINDINPGRRLQESDYREPTQPGILFAVYDDKTKKPDYIPPEAKDVPTLMKDLVEWIKGEDKLPIPVKAAILSYQLLTIHPFEDGNGRTARALATYLLSINGYDMKGFYSMEEFYVSDLEGYYSNLQMGLPTLYYDGRENPNDLSPWIEYFIRIMALAFEKVVIKIKNTNVKRYSEVNMEDLSKKDNKLLSHLLKQPDNIIKPKEIADLYGVTSRTISEWAKEWVRKGILEPASGEKRITSYILGEKYRLK